MATFATMFFDAESKNHLHEVARESGVVRCINL
jgi:hypothetical protein